VLVNLNAACSICMCVIASARRSKEVAESYRVHAEEVRRIAESISDFIRYRYFESICSVTRNDEGLISCVFRDDVQRVRAQLSLSFMDKHHSMRMDQLTRSVLKFECRLDRASSMVKNEKKNKTKKTAISIFLSDGPCWRTRRMRETESTTYSVPDKNS
jgi:hypothetical protein